MKYLFAAIDARQAKSREPARGVANGRSRPRFHPDELKRLIVEASEAVDDKSAANEFQETLERIVGEIRNTTEHSGAFLQKVRKADVPDYYDVIKRPMDLATLLKKVKQQAYRSKKAFAEDLDLIWSNCLLYNSHPNHPLRHSAEVLRAKSHQLLEFITDPAATQRTLLAASMSVAALDKRASSTRIGTPDEDGDADGESDDERSKRALSERLLNGVNGDYRDSTSPGPSRSATPGLSRRLSRKFSQGPVVHRSPTPEPPPSPTSLPFEERPAFIRTAESMQSFLLLDNELTKLEGGLGFKPTPASSSSILPPSAFDPSTALASSALATTSKKGKGKRKSQSRLVTRIQQLNPSVLPPPPPSPVASSRPATNGTSTPAITGTDSAAPTPASSSAAPPPHAPAPIKRNPDEPVEALWWDVVGPASTSCALFPPSSVESGENGVNGTSEEEEQQQHKAKDAVPLPAMVAGMPRVPWVGYRATPWESAAFSATQPTSVVGFKGKGKGRAIEEVKDDTKRGKKSKVGKEKVKLKNRGEEIGLSGRMRKNCETLRKIRSVGTKLEREGAVGVLDPPDSSDDDLFASSDEDRLPNGITHPDAMDVDGAVTSERPTKRPRLSRSLAVSIRIPRTAFRCPATAPTAAKEAMRAVAGGVLGHVGFEGASAGAGDVLSHLASEYITNLGRTLRFYADRYAAELTPSQMLTHTLSENGVPTPSLLDTYVSEDIDRYGSRLSDLLRKLERAREEQLDESIASVGAVAEESAPAPPQEEEELFREGGEAFVSGDFAPKIGDDFFGLNELGLEGEGLPTSSSLVPPTWLLKGEERPATTESAGSLTYSPPPAFIPLVPEAISSQIGLLQPYYTLRAQNPSFALLDDVDAYALNPSAVRPKGSTRHKVPPTNGRIPFKGKKRPEDPTLPAAMAAAALASLEPVKKKKKKAAIVAAASDSGGD
ncbi:hypothetical protein JCM11251_000515 [Rhodosporidiobolus azoricus]